MKTEIIVDNLCTMQWIQNNSTIYIYKWCQVGSLAHFLSTFTSV